MAFEDLPKIDLRSNELQEKIASIEKLKTGPMQKAELILILLGEKPATELSVYPEEESEAAAAIGILNRVGLSFEKISESKGRRWQVDFAVANSSDTLEKLKGLSAITDHAPYGELMGFPKTAIEAFIKKDGQELLDLDEEQKIFESQEDLIFNDFRLSRDHWHEELETLKQWSRTIKENAPKLYASLKPKNSIEETAILN